MENEQPNGATPPLDNEAAQAILQKSADAYGHALAQSKTIGGQMNINMVEMMVQLEMTRIQLALLLEALSQIGVINAAPWKMGLAQRLDAFTAQLNQPRIAIAVGRAMKGN
jgi:hypothetical protein